MTRVLRADQRGPTRIAAEVLSASERARAILERAEVEAAALRTRAVEEGRAEGRAELASKLLELAAERDRTLAGLEAQAVEVALLAAKRMLGATFEARPELFAQRVGELLERVRRAKQTTLHVHPDDGAAARAGLALWAERVGLEKPPELALDPSLERGDCIVVSDVGSLDARVTTQLAALRRALDLA